MKMKALAAIAALAVVGSAFGDAVSVNWKEFAGGVNDVVDPWGIESANNWQNLQKIQNGTDVILSSGAASTIDFSAERSLWDTWGFAPQDNTAMRAGINMFALGNSVTLSDINGTYSSYDVIVYLGGYVGGELSVSDGSTTYYAKTPTPSTTLTQVLDTDNGDGTTEGNYVRFTGLTADSTTLSIARVNGSTTNMGIGGIQVVGDVIPEPATIGLMGIAGLGLVFARRKFTH